MKFDMNPYVRYAAKSTHLIENKWIAARDARLLYVISGNVRFWVKEASYLLEPGSFLFYPYNQPYRFTDNHELLFYNLNFDFTKDYTQLSTMRPKPISEHDPQTVLYTAEDICDGIFQKALHIPNAIWAEEDMHSIYTEELKKYDGYKDMQSTLVKKLIIQICRTIRKNGENPLVAKIKATLVDHKDMKIKEIASEFGYHPFYLNEVFKKTEGETIHTYIMRLRVEAAYELITTTNMLLDEIAVSCGFSSQSHLCTTFKRMYGISPSFLRRQS